MRLNTAVLALVLSAPIVLTGYAAQVDFLRRNGLPWSPLRDAPHMDCL
jgi:hypothetical protein